MRKIEKQLRTYLSRAGVKSDQLDEAVSVFEKRFRDYYGIEFEAVDPDTGKFIEALKAGHVGSSEEKKFFSNHFANEMIRNARGTVEDDTDDMNKEIRRAAGFKSDE